MLGCNRLVSEGRTLVQIKHLKKGPESQEKSGPWKAGGERERGFWDRAKRPLHLVDGSETGANGGPRKHRLKEDGVRTLVQPLAYGSLQGDLG